MAPPSTPAHPITVRSCVLTLALFLVLGAGAWWFLTIFVPWQGTTDYSRKPPEQVFRAVLGQPVPDGVTDLRVAGRSYPFGLKHWVYMRFQATDAAIQELVGEDEPLTAQDLRKVGQPPYVSNRRFDRADRERVGWAELEEISDPEVYLVGSGEGFIWMSCVIVDRRRNLVFVGANGD